MRRTILLVAAMLLVAVMFTAPATAAPYSNPQAATWDITCPEPYGAFQVMSPFKVPGWLEGAPVPVLAMGGTFWVTENGVTSGPFIDPPPRGLMPRLVECSLDGPLGVDPYVFHLSWDPFYLFFPGS